MAFACLSFTCPAAPIPLQSVPLLHRKTSKRCVKLPRPAAVWVVAKVAVSVVPREEARVASKSVEILRNTTKTKTAS